MVDVMQYSTATIRQILAKEGYCPGLAHAPDTMYRPGRCARCGEPAATFPIYLDLEAGRATPAGGI